MKTIFSVSEGSYSDYVVHCLFTTRDFAEQYLRAMKEADKKRAEKHGHEYYDYDEYRIEEFQLHDSVPIVKEEA